MGNQDTPFPLPCPPADTPLPGLTVTAGCPITLDHVSDWRAREAAKRSGLAPTSILALCPVRRSRALVDPQAASGPDAASQGSSQPPPLSEGPRGGGAWEPLELRATEGNYMEPELEETCSRCPMTGKEGPGCPMASIMGLAGAAPPPAPKKAKKKAAGSKADGAFKAGKSMIAHVEEETAATSGGCPLHWDDATTRMLGVVAGISWISGIFVGWQLHKQLMT